MLWNSFGFQILFGRKFMCACNFWIFLRFRAITTHSGGYSGTATISETTMAQGNSLNGWCLCVRERGFFTSIYVLPKSQFSNRRGHGMCAHSLAYPMTMNAVLCSTQMHSNISGMRYIISQQINEIQIMNKYTKRTHTHTHIHRIQNGNEINGQNRAK